MPTHTQLSIASWFYLAIGVGAAALGVFVGADLRNLLVTVAVLGMLPAAWTALRVHHFPKSFALMFVAIGWLYLLFAVLPLLLDGRAELIASSALDALANILIITVLAHTVRKRRGRLDGGDLLDGAIIATGVWLIAWIALVQPLLSDSEVDTFGLVMDALYLPMAVPIIGLTMMFLFSGRLDRASNWLVAAALTFNVFGDLIYALEDSHSLGTWAYTTADTLYILAFSFAGAALVHPSAPELIADGYVRRRIDLAGRALFLALALVVPVMVLATVSPKSTADTAVRAVSVLALLGLVGIRLYQATRTTITTQQRLLDAARTDELTHLPNKAAILEQATDAMDHSWRSERCPALYLFDLDRFKNINDSLGHQSGDDVIAVIAERLALAAAALGASVGRPSADEFLVLDPSPTSEHQALSHAETLHSVFKQPLTTLDGVVFVTASVGVAAMPRGRPLSGEELFRWADIAMYRAKDSGRNCLALYDPSMQERVSQRMKVETDLHGALDRREFRLFHQPIVDVDSGRVSGFEALIRWLKPDGTMVSPAEFIPIAEDTGLIIEIGAWALLEALTQLDNWSDDGIVPECTTISVNVSPRQLADPAFPDTVQEAINRSGVAPHRLWLEVTESVMVDNPEMARTSLRRVRSMGVRIALDDFGTGYSSLSLLQQFPIHRIKIDRAFVNGVADSANDRSLVRTVIGLGESMGLDIVAEGVETVEQLRLLRSLDCAKAQGFLISHPVPSEAMRSTVAALESLADWPEFAQVVGGDPLDRTPIPGT